MMNQNTTAGKATLTSRERVNRMFAREDQDRIPRFDHYWPETRERWHQEGLESEHANEALTLLQSDFMQLAGFGPGPFAGHMKIIAEDENTITFENSWLETVKEWKGRSGTPEHVDWACKTRDDWEKTFRPAMVHADPHYDPERIRTNLHAANQRNQWRFLSTLETFEASRHLLGDVGSMIALAEDPEWIKQISEVYTDWRIRLLDAQVEVIGGAENLDGVWCCGDMAFNHSTMCSPAMYRELIWPDHKRLADWAHAHDAKFIYHTDGDIRGVLDLYVEAGFDCIQPLEAKANMDIRELCPKYGQQLATMGNIDAMILSTNDRDKIEAEIRSKLEAGMATQGYCYHSDHSIPPDVSLETYKFIIELLDRYGNYA